MKNRFLKGQSLWEVIVALGIVSLIAVGLIKITGYSVKHARFSTDQSKLTALAQERITQIIEGKNTDPKRFWDENQYFPSGDFPCTAGSVCTEENETEDYCLVIRVSDSSSEIPTTAPNFAAARMATIEVNVYWEKGSGTDCGAYQYRHTLNFKTTVSD